MELEVTFSEQAYETLYAILDFLEENWGKNYSTKLLAIIYKKIDIIATQPSIYEETQIIGLRKAVVSNYTSFYYQVHQKEIRIIFFLDNRQEPLLSK